MMQLSPDANPLLTDLPQVSEFEPTFTQSGPNHRGAHASLSPGASGVTSSGGSLRSSLAERRSGSLGRAILPMTLDAGEIHNSRDKEQPQETIHAKFRGWRMTSDGKSIPVGMKDALTVMTYNVLCPRYATSDKYPQCAAWELAETYRYANVLHEIAGAEPDIICFQELSMEMCETDYFGKVLEARGYSFEHVAITDKRGVPVPHKDVEGVAVFYKKTRFSLEESIPIRFNAVAQMENKAGRISDEGAKKLCGGSHNVALTVTLRDICSEFETLFVVSTIHAFYDQSKPEWQIWQLHKLLEQNSQIKSQWSAVDANVAALIMGDFNAEPQRPPMSFVRSGTSELAHPPNLPHLLMHDLRLAGAYDEYLAEHKDHVTSIGRDFHGVIDHILLDADALKCTAVAYLQPPSVEVPNQWIPSDHFPLAATIVPITSL